MWSEAASFLASSREQMRKQVIPEEGIRESQRESSIMWHYERSKNVPNQTVSLSTNQTLSAWPSCYLLHDIIGGLVSAYAAVSLSL